MCEDRHEHGCKEHGHHAEGGCGCEGHQDRFIDAAMMLLIARNAGHGYDIVERLKEYGFDAVDSTKVYRRLRRLEADGLLTSQWLSDTAGPARRAYTITAEGTDYLLTWKPTAERTLSGYKAFIRDLDGLYAVK